MSDTQFTRNDINHLLYEVAKEYQKLNRKDPHCEIILVGGASVLINYGFRGLTTDFDANIRAASSMKDAINKVGNRHDLPAGWINEDFKKTSSYSNKLATHSKYYRTFYGMDVRTISGEYLLAMKLRSYRQYKHDISDIIGIIIEEPALDIETIENAYFDLYQEKLPEEIRNQVDEFLHTDDLEELLKEIRDREKSIGVQLKDFDGKYPGVLTSANIDDIISKFKTNENQRSN